jgi:hypothetical protein
MYGIEKDKIAHALASIVVWIGYLQWKIHKRIPVYDPILYNPYERIWNKDAILQYDDTDQPIEPEWPVVDVIIGNPPFLGNRDFLALFGSKYVADLNRVYSGRLPSNVDLVTFWFAKAYQILEKTPHLRVGLVATSRINQIQNRIVLKKIKEIGDIFNAWRERVWHDGQTAVRVSMICFDNGSEQEKYLDGKPVGTIHGDLTAGVDISKAKLLKRPCLVTMGTKKYGTFDIDSQTAAKMLSAENPTKASNSDVVRRWANGSHIANNTINRWIIDFHNEGNKTLEEAKQYELPFKYILENVKPHRLGQRNQRLENEWWLYEAPRNDLRAAIEKLNK